MGPKWESEGQITAAKLQGANKFEDIILNYSLTVIINECRSSRL